MRLAGYQFALTCPNWIAVGELGALHGPFDIFTHKFSKVDVCTYEPRHGQSIRLIALDSTATASRSS